MTDILLKSLYIFLIIVWLTIMQKYYSQNMYYIVNKQKILWIIFRIIQRIWVIIHEFCHLFFGILAWNKPKEIHLFKANWWNVVFETKDYIWSLPNNWHSPIYLFYLVLNQIWIFLTSIWPLLVWVVLNIFVIKYLDINITDLKSFKIDIYKIIVIIIYSIILPSFVLSYKDIKNFIISKQSNIFSTIFASIINTLIFVWFLIAMSFLFDGFLIFSILFWIYFVIIIIIRIISSI